MIDDDLEEENGGIDDGDGDGVDAAYDEGNMDPMSTLSFNSVRL